METTTEALRTLDEALHQLVGCDKERSQLSAQVQLLEQEFMNYCDEPSATATRISKELEKASQVRPPTTRATPSQQTRPGPCSARFLPPQFHRGSPHRRSESN